MAKLPADKAQSVAKIVGRDGTPDPKRWHFLLYDATAPSGVREMVVAGGEIVASRTVSQFAESLSPQDVLGAGTVRVDSAELAEIAQDYAAANGAVIASINYELRREGADSVPVWLVTCLDDAGGKVGEISVTAGRAAVISHDGFSVAPGVATAKTSPPPRFETDSGSALASPTPSQTASSAGKGKSKKRRARDEDDDMPPPERVFRKIGGTFQKIFTGKDTISR